MLNAFSASSDGVVASTGTSNFWIVESDSPSLPRRFDDALLSALSTSCFDDASSCSLAQRVAGAATDRVNTDKVLVAQTGNRSHQKRLAAGSNAEFPRNIPRNAFIRSPAHQAKCFLDLAVGENIEKRRLSELHGERLLQSIIKDGIAGLIVEVG
jgi:Flp pilus assembly protein CpaB